MASNGSGKRGEREVARRANHLNNNCFCFLVRIREETTIEGVCFEPQGLNRMSKQSKKWL
jgi:hypothetical protein